MRLSLMLTLNTLFVGVLFWVWVGYRVATVSENHVSHDPMVMIWLFYALLVFSISTVFLKKRAIFLLATVFAVGSIYGLHVIDQKNILVQYDKWLKRGMPGRGS